MNDKLTSALDKLPFNNYKTIIGAVLIALSILATVLSDVLLLFPEVSYLSTLLKLISYVLDNVGQYAEWLALPPIYLGLIHKWGKRRRNIK